MRHRDRAVVLVCLAALALLCAPASADTEEKPAKPYWSVSFLGGVLEPYKGMKNTHKRGLAAGTRIGWTSKMGLGFDLVAEYSPLPRDNLPDLTTYETHYLAASAGPRFTLGRGAIRVWVAGTGGMAVERSKVFVREVVTDKSTQTAFMATGSAGLELHLMSSGGLQITGSFTRTTKRGLAFTDGLKYKYASLTGGLVFTF